MPDVKVEGGSLTGKVAAGVATVGAALGAVALSGKGSGKADVEVKLNSRIYFDSLDLLRKI